MADIYDEIERALRSLGYADDHLREGDWKSLCRTLAVANDAIAEACAEALTAAYQGGHMTKKDLATTFGVTESALRGLKKPKPRKQSDGLDGLREMMRLDR